MLTDMHQRAETLGAPLASRADSEKAPVALHDTSTLLTPALMQCAYHDLATS